MNVESRSLHTGRAQRIWADSGIGLADTVTTQFVARLLAAVDAEGDYLLRRLAGDPHERVAFQARRELDRRRASP